MNVYIPRLVWMTPQHIAGGQLGLYAAQPLVDLRLSAMGMSDSNSGFWRFDYWQHVGLA